MCWTFCWTKCWTLFLAKIRILSAISISSGDRLGKLLGDGAGEGIRTLDPDLGKVTLWVNGLDYRRFDHPSDRRRRRRGAVLRRGPDDRSPVILPATRHTLDR